MSEPASPSPRVLLVHWHPEEAEALAAPVRDAGYPVEVVAEHWEGGMSRLRADPPRAMVISLRRLPSHGRAVAEALRQTRWGREIPLVFLDTPAARRETFSEKFPDAAFLSVDELALWLDLPAGGPGQL